MITMRTIKPFDLDYLDYNIRVTNIKKNKEQKFIANKLIFENEHYIFDLIFKRNGKREHFLQKLDIIAEDITDLKFKIRTHLIQSNFM